MGELAASADSGTADGGQEEEAARCHGAREGGGGSR